MRNLLKKLHIMPNQLDVSDGSSSKGSRLIDCPSGASSPSRSSTELKLSSSSGISSWLSSVATKHASCSPSSNSISKKDVVTSSDDNTELSNKDCQSCHVRDPALEEEYQIQIAMELSAREDPEAVQIEAVKQISLVNSPSPSVTAEIIAYRYWNYSALTYDDKILDGFYDLYGVLTETAPEKMPSLIDLQRIPVSDDISWEAVLVNRTWDPDLLGLERRVQAIAWQSKSSSQDSFNKDLVHKLATLVSDYMGGSVVDPEKTSKAWRSMSDHLRASVGSVVLPLGQLKIGLARHRALMFKVLADSVSMPCCLVKGQQYTGSDDAAMNIVKLSNGREYIVDLMADPGTLIPSDAASSLSEIDRPPLAVSLSGSMNDSHHINCAAQRITALEDVLSKYEPLSMTSTVGDSENVHRKARTIIKTFPENNLGNCGKLLKEIKDPALEPHGRLKFNHSHLHARSPSWTEGVSSPAVHRMKVKDVSEYMLDATKDNPQLAQKLHDVLLESGVVAPPGLFTKTYSNEVAQEVNQNEHLKEKGDKAFINNQSQVDGLPGPALPPLLHHSKPNVLRPRDVKPMMNLADRHLDNRKSLPCNPGSSQPEVPPLKLARNMPVAAAAAATAAVVASSMVVAVAKSNADSNIEVPVAAAAAVVATTAAVSRQYEKLESSLLNQINLRQEVDGGNDLEVERIENRSSVTLSDVALDDVAEWEMPWDEIIFGEKIGFGSYGEVYRGEWRGTEVAVKRFIDQDISGDRLQEFRSEVRIIKMLRHPNVVLFMGAVMRPPNLSIITEFLHRGSLFKLLHRPNNQLDEKKRLRMAIDVARGMNYLHNCTPMIVHRDLKSPNLLVDRNWVVKVCDFGLSQMKQSTFLSSRSTAGTAEWMAPEVLRNEPSDEKCDVYSFGVILWELTTLQQPWGGMNPMQVVGAVGFQHRRLDIPEDTNPVIADIIRKCWQTDPKLRPTFLEILAALKPLQKQMMNVQALIFQISNCGINS